MNNANLMSPSSVANAETVKLLVFPIGSLNVALSIDTVKKVVNYSTILGSGLNYYGLVNLGNEEITVIDLHKKLFNTSQSLTPEDKKYLLLAENSGGETFGIMIKSSPELYDIKLNIIRALPDSYRHADTLKIASHVFIIEEEENDLQKTVFLLDPDELVIPT